MSDLVFDRYVRAASMVSYVGASRAKTRIPVDLPRGQRLYHHRHARLRAFATLVAGGYDLHRINIEMHAEPGELLLGCRWAMRSPAAREIMQRVADYVPRRGVAVFALAHIEKLFDEVADAEREAERPRPTGIVGADYATAHLRWESEHDRGSRRLSSDATPQIEARLDCARLLGTLPLAEQRRLLAAVEADDLGSVYDLIGRLRAFALAKAA